MKNFWSDLPFYLLAGFFCVLPVFMVAFATIRYALSRFQPHQPHPKRWATAAATVATPLLCCAGFRLVVFFFLYYPQQNFNPGDWALNQDKRYEMVADLRASRRVIGLSPDQVTALLGSPNYQQENTWLYYLGMKPSFMPVDGDYLRLEFYNDKVVRVGINQN